MDQRSASVLCSEWGGRLPRHSDLQALEMALTPPKKEAVHFAEKLRQLAPPLVWLHESESTDDYWASAYDLAQHSVHRRRFWDDEHFVLCLRSAEVMP